MSPKHMVFIGLIISSVVACSDDSDHPESAAICMATLAHKNAWSDTPKGGQSAFGTYLGTGGYKIHKFKSHNGRYEFACEVKGNRVHTAQAPTDLAAYPRINYNRHDEIYTFKIVSNSIDLEISYGSGQPERASFSLPHTKGRL